MQTRSADRGTLLLGLLLSFSYFLVVQFQPERVDRQPSVSIYQIREWN